MSKVYTKTGTDTYTPYTGPLSYQTIANGNGSYYFNSGGDPDAEISYYYALSIPDGQGKKYLVGDKKDNLNKDTHDPDATIFTGVLYTQGDPQTVYTATATYEKGGPGNNVTVTILEASSATEKKAQTKVFSIGKGNTYTKVEEISWQEIKNNPDKYFYLKNDNADLNKLKNGDFAKITANNPTTTYSYDDLERESYSYDDIINAGTTYYFKDGDTYKAVTAEKLTDDNPPVWNQIKCDIKTVSDAGENCYGLTFTVGTTKYYLTPDGSCTTTPTGVTDKTTTIYSGYLYSNTRIAALQAAVEAFLNTVTEMSKGDDHEWDSGDDLSNNVAVELFADHRRGITALLPFGTEQEARESTATILQLVNNTNTATGTGHDIGMYDARAILEAAKQEGRSQSVVMFTDGEPYANSNRNTGEPKAGTTPGRTAIAQNAVDISYDIKNTLGATIYVVSMLDDKIVNPETGSYPYVAQYVEYMSSKYPKAKTITGGEKGTSNPNTDYLPAVWLNDEHTESYCMAYSEGNDLTSIFTTIAEHTSTEGHGTAVTANETSVVVFDAMTDHFKLPDGADASKISVWAVPCTGKSTGTDGTVTYTFNENEKVFKTAGADNVMSNIDVKVAGKVVNVIGFDYAGNYCGEHGTEEVSGYKLVISFPIYIDPANPGGTYLQTNEATSGIYYTKDEDEDGKPDTQDGLYELGASVKPLPVPHVDLPNIVIRKKGLTKPGESATFLIEPVGGTAGEAFSVVITCKDAADARKADTGIYAKVKLQAEGRYKVTETSWAWGYTPEATGGFTEEDGHSVKDGLSITRNVCKATQEPDGITKNGVGTIFEFTNTKNNNYDEMKYSEAYKRNVFYTPSKYIWTNSTGSGTEISDDPAEGWD